MHSGISGPGGIPRGDHSGRSPARFPRATAGALALVLCTWGSVTGTGLQKSRVRSAKARVPRQCPVPAGLSP